MKYKEQEYEYAPMIDTMILEVLDTKIGHINLKHIQKSLTEGSLSKSSRKIADSGLVDATCFPIAVQCIKLVVECARGYNPNAREIRTIDGCLMAKLDGISIAITSRLPYKEKFTCIDKQKAYKYFSDNKSKYLNNLAKKWMVTSWGGQSQLPKMLHHSLFIKEIFHLIVLLHRVTSRRLYSIQNMDVPFHHSHISRKTIHWLWLSY